MKFTIVNKSDAKGFTLIEILVVIGILAVLFGIVLLAINPSRQFSLANNTKRRSDVNAILNSIHQYVADHHGILPAGISTTSVQEVSNTGSNICSTLVTQYIAALPVDPLTNGGTAIFYSFFIAFIRRILLILFFSTLSIFKIIFPS
jgi:prepilin-type N-terminal cleavage/methylation domain-containing protein